MAHPTIKKFSLEGTFADEADVTRIRAQMESLVIQDFRGKGYVPVLDLDPAFSLMYHVDNDTWSYELTIYAIYVGRKKSWLVEGMSSNKLLPRSIRKSKLETS